MGSQANPHDDDMPAEIDFSKGTRGKSHRPVDEFFAALDCMAAVDEPPPMSTEEVAAEIEAKRSAS